MSDGLEAFLWSAIAIAAFFLILALFLRRPPTPGRTFGFIFVGQEKFVMSKSVIQGSSHTATALFTDASGVARPLFSVPAWSVVPADALTLSPAADGFTCPFVAGNSDQDFTLTVTAEGDPTAGVNVITGNFAGTITDPEDTQVQINVD